MFPDELQTEDDSLKLKFHAQSRSSKPIPLARGWIRKKFREEIEP